MKALFAAIFAIVLATNVGAQTINRANLESQVSSAIFDNNQQLVTPKAARNTLLSILNNTGVLADTNAWTGANSFAGPITLPLCSGFLHGNAGLVADCRTTVDGVAQVINPRDSQWAGGAKGNNLANDTAAIQAAMNSAPSLGEHIHLPAGEYRVYGTLTIRSGSFFECDPGAVIYEMTRDTVFMNPAANMNWGTDFTPATLANMVDDGITINDCTVNFSQATATQTSPYPFGPGFAAFTLAQHISLERNLVIGDVTGTNINQIPNAIRLAKVWNSHADHNRGIGLYNGFGVWGGSNYVDGDDNDWTIAPNSTSSNPYSCSNINGQGTATNDHQALAHVHYRRNICRVQGGTYSPSVVAYNNGTLSAGSAMSDFEFSGNRTIATGSHNWCYSAGGAMDHLIVNENYFEGCDGLGLILDAGATSWGTQTNAFTTTNGSSLVSVAIAAVTTANVTVGNYLYAPSTTTPVGGLTLSGLHPVTAVASGVVTIDAGAVATSNANGGGAVALSTYWGTVRDSTVTNLHFKNVNSKPNDGLVVVLGPSNTLGNVSVEGGSYGAVTLTSNFDCCSANTPIPNTVYGVHGVAGTGVTAPTGGFPVSGDNTNAFQTNYSPTLLDYAAITTTGTWLPYIKFGTNTSDITYSVQSGWWTKNGPIFHYCGNLTLTSIGTQTGPATLQGFPFSLPAHQVGALVLYQRNFVGVVGTLIAIASGGGPSYGMAVFVDNSNATSLTDANFSNSTVLNFCGDYSTP